MPGRDAWDGCLYGCLNVYSFTVQRYWFPLMLIPLSFRAFARTSRFKVRSFLASPFLPLELAFSCA